MYRLTIVAAALAASMAAGCSGSDRAGSEPRTVSAPRDVTNLRPPPATPVSTVGAEVAGSRECGLASFYGDHLIGNQTASGERYDPQRATAAHRALPFGTLLKVTRVSTGRSSIVRVNDRGPFVEGRIIDVSRMVADELGFRRAGVDRVCVTVMTQQS